MHPARVKVTWAVSATVVEDDEFDAMLARLGTHNTFLHSEMGRTFADKVFAKAMSLGDKDAVAGGTKFLNICLRGHIAKKNPKWSSILKVKKLTYVVHPQKH